MGNFNPKGFRLKIINTWSSIWYAEKGYKQGLHQDLSIRNYINESFKHAGVSKVIIERTIDLVSVTIQSEVMRYYYDIPFIFGGTSLLIIVNVITDTIMQVQSYIFSNRYDNWIKKYESKTRKVR